MPQNQKAWALVLALSVRGRYITLTNQLYDFHKSSLALVHCSEKWESWHAIVGFGWDYASVLWILKMWSGIMISQFDNRLPWPELHHFWAPIHRYLSNSAVCRGKNTAHLSLPCDCYPLYDFLASMQWFIRWGNYVLVYGEGPKQTSLLPLWDKILVNG